MINTLSQRVLFLTVLNRWNPFQRYVSLDEVLKLPRRKQKELAQLLDEADLSGIISAATLVADRLKFLEALRFILFDFEARQKLKERSQLHKILEQNTWIFGEEFHLWASDKELTTVLKTHRDKIDPELVIDDPVKIVHKTRGVVDLMLSRAQRRHRHNDIEHLVVELKAPKVKLTAEHRHSLKTMPSLWKRTRVSTVLTVSNGTSGSFRMITTIKSQPVSGMALIRSDG
jgi:hypothetical protein